ncbi:MAG: hypothetical protein NT157_02530 [Candidatus Micrarchaeota archaeon]|nr:hypothetical protein [Candidatus Micrarchaeota archaeon]
MEQKQLPAKKLPHFTWGRKPPYLPKFSWQKDRRPLDIASKVKGGNLGVIRMLEELNPVVERWNKEATALERWKKDAKAIERYDIKELASFGVNIRRRHEEELEGIIQTYVKAPREPLITKRIYESLVNEGIIKPPKAQEEPAETKPPRFSWKNIKLG